MALIETIRLKFAADEIELPRHTAMKSLVRNIAVREIREAIETGEVIEAYPNDKYGPSCLTFGHKRQ